MSVLSDSKVSLTHVPVLARDVPAAIVTAFMSMRHSVGAVTRGSS